MNVHDYVENVKSGNIDVVEYIENVLEEAERINSAYNYYTTICSDLAIGLAKMVKNNPKGKLAGVPVSVKDCICVKGVETTSSSDILKGYKPVFHATVVQKLINEGAIIIGKTVQDEFGFGSFSVNVGKSFKVPLNPVDPLRSCGGSSGGAAGVAAKSNLVHLSLAESTGGSIACPSSFCGVNGFTPTYGNVSRYGLIDYGSSLDKIGVIGKDLNGVELMFDVIKGHDANDSTSIEHINEKKEITKVAVIKSAFDVDDKVKSIVEKKLSDIEYDEIELPLTKKYSLSSYSIIAMAEASTNLAKFCGMRYGAQPDITMPYNEQFTKVRSNNLGKETKRRIIIGTFARMSGYRDAYYIKALKVRQAIINEYKKTFKTYDALISPTMPILPPLLKNIENLNPLDIYKMDQLTVGVNLAGLPHLSSNAGYFEGLPVGMMVVGNHFNDNAIFDYVRKTW
ncbi:Asp-tRNA(Asn)/Glu-tRNA(Gln) amidotransferase subunit GatA [Candidatus Woesearchaeota archaeon]|nr:MAG: Asp-tRNA(Asn)/Glu-tRNA(Gln) amidotransferase subunit GatA [Candidatus Woesearchaeota archaeon]